MAKKDPRNEMTTAINPDKKDKIINLLKSLKSLDDAMDPYREQKKELKDNYVKENKWLTKEEFDTVKKAYNFLKRKMSFEDLQEYIEIGKEVMGTDE